MCFTHVKWLRWDTAVDKLGLLLLLSSSLLFVICVVVAAAAVGSQMPFTNIKLCGQVQVVVSFFRGWGAAISRSFLEPVLLGFFSRYYGLFDNKLKIVPIRNR